MTLQWLKHNSIILLLIVLYGALQLFIITRSLDFLLTNVLPDDAFYYFKIARNISAGLGSSFDGINMTNGYHPLWMLILVPIFALFSDGGINDLMPVRIALGVSLICNIGSALLFMHLIRRYTRVTLIYSLVFVAVFFNPFLLFQLLNGLETSLTFLLTLLFIKYAFDSVTQKTARLYRLTALVAALLILARLDMSLIVGSFFVWMLIAFPQERKKLLYAACTGALLIIPWIYWNVSNFGMLLTSASAGNTIVNHQLIVQDHGSSIIQWLKALIYNTHFGFKLVMNQTGIPYLLLLIGGAAIYRILIENKQIPFFKYDRWYPEIVFFFGWVLLFVANVSIRWTARPWYFISASICVGLLITWLLHHLLQHTRYKKSLVVLIAATMIFSLYVGWSKDVRNQYLLHREMYAAAQWMNENLPIGSRIGAFNSGIQGYFSKHQVINLDGLVNNAASEALKNRQSWTYIKDNDIDYLCDFDIYYEYRYRSFLDTKNFFDEVTSLHTVVSTPNSRSQNGISIYKVNN